LLDIVLTFLIDQRRQTDAAGFARLKFGIGILHLLVLVARVNIVAKLSDTFEVIIYQDWI
jgi:hypothetical protein